jgi:hypothetical protein
MNWDGIWRGTNIIGVGGVWYTDWWSFQNAGPLHGPFPNGVYQCYHCSQVGLYYYDTWWGWTYGSGTIGYCGTLHTYEVRAGIEANITFWPKTLNLGSEGTWIKCAVEFPVPAMDTVDNIDVSTVQIENVIDAEANMKYGFVKTLVIQTSPTGYPEAMIKFDRDGVCMIIDTAQTIELMVAGYTTNNIAFYGAGEIHAIKYYDHPK